MLASQGAVMQKAVSPNIAQPVMITFPLLACTHDCAEQVRKNYCTNLRFNEKSLLSRGKKNIYIVM